MITQQLLKELLDYDPDTGLLVWKARPGNKAWNSRFAGKKAGSNENRYSRIRIFDKNYLSHRVIWMHVFGEWPNEIDHVNGNGFDNRIANLRDVSHKENMKNQKRSKANKSKTTGVCWHKQTGKWQAKICVNGRWEHLGVFDDINKAKEIRAKAENEYKFHKNHGKLRDKAKN